jgi:hypothetical protein
VDPDVVEAAYGLAQGGEHVGVDLDRVHEPGPLGEKRGKEPASRADL